MGTAFEANIGIMTHQGKHGLPRRSKDRLWTGRPGVKGSCRQVHLNQAESFTLGKFGLGLGGAASKDSHQEAQCCQC